MTIQEIKEKYNIEELTSSIGDEEYRKYVFMPLLKELNYKKVIIHDRITCIATIKGIQTDDKKFTCLLEPIEQIKRGNNIDRLYTNLSKGWEIGSSWKSLRILNNALSSYSGWLLWFDEVIIDEVETLLKENKYKEALQITLYETRK